MPPTTNRQSMRIITINMNGIRAATRKGFYEWLATQQADLVCLQETRIQQEQLTEAQLHPPTFHGFFSFAEQKGYSGVGIYSKQQPLSVQTRADWPAFDQEGRFLLLEFKDLFVVSLYLPSGTRGDVRQEFKYQTLEWFQNWVSQILATGKELIVCGDLNIAHQKIDLKNWRGNQKNSGFLPEEREWMSCLLQQPQGLQDVFRKLYPEKEAYTWWSNRGRAWDNNVGWRIDYQLATPTLAGTATEAFIYRDQRFSDHAPLLVDYDWNL